MRFYIATKFQNKEGVKNAIRLLTKAGHTVPFDWSEAQVANREQAELDVKGVRDAQALLGLFEEEYEYKGAIVEFGIAVALGKPIFIIGNKLDSMIFIHLPNVYKFNTVEDVIRFLR